MYTGQRGNGNGEDFAQILPPELAFHRNNSISTHIFYIQRRMQLLIDFGGGKKQTLRFLTGNFSSSSSVMLETWKKIHIS